MTEPQRWVVRHSFLWPPILTFHRRRQLLLEWYEANVDVVEVLDKPDVLGVAVGDPAHRLILRRGGVDLLALRPEASEDQLLAAMSGIFEVIGPREIEHEGSGSTWSQPLSADYAAACRALATRAIAVAPGSQFQPADVSVLSDVSTDTSEIQVEFGIVLGNELEMRLTTKELSRTDRGLPSLRQPTSVAFPETAIFAEIYSRRTAVGAVADVSDVYRVCSECNDEANALMKELESSMVSAEGNP